MPCACQKNKVAYEVVADGGNGAVLYTSTSKVAADAIAKRPQNQGAIVREKGKAA